MYYNSKQKGWLQLLRAGVSTASFFGRKVVEDCLEDIRALGCDTAEVFLNTVSEYRPEFVQMLVSRLGGLKVHSVHALGTQFEPQLYSSPIRVRADAERVFEAVCRAGQMLGAKYITFHGPYRMKKREYIIDYPSFGARTRELCAEAARYGLGLSYENVHYAYFNDAEFFERLVKYVPELYATLDVKQAIQGGADIDKIIEVTKGRLSTVHICGADSNNNTYLPREGTYDFGALIKKLKKTGYNNPVILEVYTGDYSDLSQLKASYDYIKSLIKEC